MARRAAIGIATAVTAWSLIARVALGAPEWDTAVLGGVTGTGDNRTLWSRTRFYGAFRGDLLFGRSRSTDFGFGPALELGTVGFSDVRLLGGAMALVPFGQLVTLGVTPGAYVRSSPMGAVAGLSGRAFLGARSYNFSGTYALAGGILFGVDEDLDSSRQHAIVIAAQVDAALFALPVILLVSWLHGPRE